MPITGGHQLKLKLTMIISLQPEEREYTGAEARGIWSKIKPDAVWAGTPDVNTGGVYGDGGQGAYGPAEVGGSGTVPGSERTFEEPVRRRKALMISDEARAKAMEAKPRFIDDVDEHMRPTRKLRIFGCCNGNEGNEGNEGACTAFELYKLHGSCLWGWTSGSRTDREISNK